MKKAVLQIFLAAWLLMSASEVNAQSCGDVIFSPTSSPCNPSPTYAYDVCLYDLDECSWEPCCDTSSRFYLGPVYFLRRTDLILDDCTSVNVFNLTNNGRVRGQYVGVNFGYEYRTLCSLYFRADATWACGNSRGCPRGNINEWQAEGRIGYTWGECVPAGWGFTPYVGVGYLWQNRKYSRIGFNAEYHTWFAPLGIYADVEVMHGFTAGVDFAFAPFFSTDVKAFHRDFDFDHNGDSRNRYMWRVSVPLRWQVMVDSGFEVSVEPFWEQIHFGRVCSQTNDLGIFTKAGVPQFREDYWGGKFLAAYKF